MRGRIRIIFTFGLSAVVFILIGFYSWLNARRYKNDNQWVAHTYEVISQAQNMLSNLTNMGTTSRGYATSGDESYLTQFNESIKNIDQTFSVVKNLTRDNEQQQELLDSIHALIIEKTKYGQEMISARSIGGFDQAKEMIWANKSQKVTQQYRDAIGRFIKNEKDLLDKRLNKAESQFSFVFYTTIISISLSILFVIGGLFYFLSDYNRRIISEQKVTESESRIKKFLDVLPLGVFIFGRDRKAYYANSKSTEILGRDITEIADVSEIPNLLKIYKAGTDDPYPSGELPIMRALTGESLTIDDLEIINNGKRTPLRVNSKSVVDSHGKIEYAISVFEDITEVKKAEQELIRAKQKAEESSILKEAFLANMSHEIRTPMNAIIGFTELLEKSNLELKEKEYVDIIKTSGENLLHIINDILDISKIEARMMTFESFPLSVKELLYSIKVMLSQKAEAKNLSLIFACEPEVPDTLIGDAKRLTQILINLVGNAIKFTESGKVEASAQLLSENEDKCVIQFSVRDTGIGIPADKLQKIFERFEQAESNTSHKYGGTGLGLSIARQLVEFQGGEMNVKSTLNAGTEFSFTLPFLKSKNESTGVASAVKEFDINELSKFRILLAEDSAVSVKLITSIFKQYDIKVDVAENGVEAVEKIKNGNYDLVLMDMEMPEMNGYEATTVIRGKLNNPIPIIAMTAHAMAGEIEKCLNLGMNDYISKPINAKLLFEKIYNNIKGTRNEV